MAHEWCETTAPRRWPLGIGVLLVAMLALMLWDGYGMLTHEPPLPMTIAPDEQLATTIITASGWTMTIEPDGADGFTATATRGDAARLVASGATRAVAADALARKVAGR